MCIAIMLARKRLFTSIITESSDAHKCRRMYSNVSLLFFHVDENAMLVREYRTIDCFLFNRLGFLYLYPEPAASRVMSQILCFDARIEAPLKSTCTTSPGSHFATLIGNEHTALSRDEPSVITSSLRTLLSSTSMLCTGTRRFVNSLCLLFSTTQSPPNCLNTFRLPVSRSIKRLRSSVGRSSWLRVKQHTSRTGFPQISNFPTPFCMSKPLSWTSISVPMLSANSISCADKMNKHG